MWQHAVNIVVGLMLISTSFLMTSVGVLSTQELWIFVGAGVIVTVLSCWGLYDELVYESDKKRNESDFI